MTDKIVAERAAGSAQIGLERWFGERGVARPSVVIHPGPQATGYSHETIVFDLSDASSMQRLVARVEPLGDHNIFPDPDLSIEYDLLEKLGPQGVAVPRLHGFEPDPSFLGAPFYVMGYVDGLVPSDSPPYCIGGWLYDSTPQQRASVWWSGLEAMTRVHAVDHRSLGFVNAGRPIGFQGELEYWGRYIDFAGGDPAPSVARAWTWLVQNEPQRTATTLCWGDSRLGNQLFSDHRCVALLDWEMACLSDPVQDLAWFVYFDDVFSSGIGVPRLAGLPGREETIGRYEELTGTTVRDLDYFEVFAAVRFALIMQRLFTLQAERGLPTAGFPRDNFVTAHLERMCDEKGIP